MEYVFGSTPRVILHRSWRRQRTNQVRPKTAKVKGTSQALSQFPHLMVQSGQSSYAATILVQEHTSEYDLECVEVQPTSEEKVSGYL